MTGGETRFSQVKETDPQIEKPLPFSNEDIQILETLGFTPSTVNAFYTKDLIDFYREKTVGKGSNTVRKYSKTLFDIREMVEASSFTSWRELDEEDWEKWIVYDFIEINGPVSKSYLNEFLSTVKAFTKWIDKKKKTKIAKEVATFISEVEGKLVQAIELLNQYDPYQRYRKMLDSKLDDDFYHDNMEGTFKITQKKKGSIVVQELEEDMADITVKMSPTELNYVEEGMILIGEIGKEKAGTYTFVDLIQVFVKEAAYYYEIY